MVGGLALSLNHAGCVITPCIVFIFFIFSQLVSLLKDQGYHKVKLQTILCGAMGTTYTNLTQEPLQQLGLEYHQVMKLTHSLNKLAIQCAAQIINTRHHLTFNLTNSGQGVGSCASARNPPEPH